MVIILVKFDGDEDHTVYGPFANGDVATSWGWANINDRTGNWHWLPLTVPAGLNDNPQE